MGTKKYAASATSASAGTISTSATLASTTTPSYREIIEVVNVCTKQMPLTLPRPLDSASWVLMVVCKLVSLVVAAVVSSQRVAAVASLVAAVVSSQRVAAVASLVVAAVV